MIAGWVAIIAALGAFLIGIGIGVILAWSDIETRRDRRRQGFIDPGMSRERLGLEDGWREGRSGRGRLRPMAADAIEGPPEFRTGV